MGMKSYQVHFMNKYPDCQIRKSDSAIDVYSASGEHLLRLEKNGAGQILDVSEENGLPERFDLSPIPRESRVHKLHKDGKIGLDEEHASRKEWAKENKKDGKILSIEEYKAQ